MFGYIITAYGHEALEMYEECDRIRFAARLDNAHGIVAFDGDVPEHVRAGSVIHVIHDAQEPIPEYPDSWPKRLWPKRGVANGLEHFAFVSTDFRKVIEETEAVTGMIDVGNGQILVESQGPIVAGMVWSGGVVEFRDRRLVSVDDASWTPATV